MRAFLTLLVFCSLHSASLAGEERDSSASGTTGLTAKAAVEAHLKARNAIDLEAGLRTSRGYAAQSVGPSFAHAQVSGKHLGPEVKVIKEEKEGDFAFLTLEVVGRYKGKTKTLQMIAVTKRINGSWILTYLDDVKKIPDKKKYTDVSEVKLEDAQKEFDDYRKVLERFLKKVPATTKPDQTKENAKGKPNPPGEDEISRKENPEAVYKQIIQVWSNGQQSEAERRLEEAVKAYPTDAPIAFFHAACIRSRFMIGMSLPLFRKLSKENGLLVEGKAARCIALLDCRQDTEKQLAAMEKLVQENQENLVLRWMYAIELRSTGRHREAVSQYQKLRNLVKVGPVLLYQSYANSLTELGRHKEALPLRRMAVKLERNWWSVSALVGTLQDLGHHKEAVPLLEDYLTVKPHWADGWNKLGISYFSLGEVDKAVSAYSKCVEVEPDNRYAWGNLGGICRKRKQYKESTKYLKKAFEIRKEESFGISLADSYFRIKDYENCYKVYYKVVHKMKSRRNDVRFELAYVCSLTNRQDECIKVLKYLQKKNALKEKHLRSKWFDPMRQNREFIDIVESFEPKEKKTIRKDIAPEAKLF